MSSDRDDALVEMLLKLGSFFRKFRDGIALSVYEREREAEAKARAHKERIQQQMSECKDEIDFCEQEKQKLESQAFVTSKLIEEGKKELDVVTQDIQRFDSKVVEEIANVEKEQKLDQIQKQLTTCSKQVEAAIEKTGVKEENIEQFLKLSNQLSNATFSNQLKVQSLETTMSSLAEMIGKVANIEEVEISKYFKSKKRSDLASILIANNFHKMEDLVCESIEKYDKIVQIVSDGMLKNHEAWSKLKDTNTYNPQEPPKEMKSVHKTFLRNVCLKPSKWRKETNYDKIRMVKCSLDRGASFMKTFFNQIEMGLSDAQNLLSFEPGLDLNMNQKIALQESGYAAQNGEDSKSTDGACDGARELSVVQVETQVKQCVQLIDLATQCVSVFNVMCKNLDKDDVSLDDSRALASRVQDASLDLVKGQGDIGKSMVVSNAISKMRPNQLTQQSRTMWDSVQSGVSSISEASDAMQAAGKELIRFFREFEKSYDLYISAPKDLRIEESTKALRKTIKDFVKFATHFEQSMVHLRNKAEKCMKSCVKSSIGSSAFVNSLKTRKERHNDLLKARKVCDAKRESLNREKSLLVAKAMLLEDDILKHQGEQRLLAEKRREQDELIEKSRRTANTYDFRKLLEIEAICSEDVTFVAGAKGVYKLKRDDTEKK